MKNNDVIAVTLVVQKDWKKKVNIVVENVKKYITVIVHVKFNIGERATRVTVMLMVPLPLPPLPLPPPPPIPLHVLKTKTQTITATITPPLPKKKLTTSLQQALIQQALCRPTTQLTHPKRVASG